MSIDVIIIADAGATSYSGTNPLKLSMNNRDADIQAVVNFIENDGELVSPVAGDGVMSWASAPKLNGITLYDILTRHGHRAEIINNYANEKTRFADLIRQSPRAVVISTTFISQKDTLRTVAADIRREAPDVAIIAGGPFVYTSYQLLQRSSDGDYDTRSPKAHYLFLDTADEPDIDLYVVSIRGEHTLLEVLRNLNEGRSFHDAPNTAWRSGDGYAFSRRVDDVSYFNDTPIDWAGIPDDQFRSGVVSLQASIGCTSDCEFCNFSKDPRLNRIKPLGQLVDEMKAVAARGAKYVWFTDDNFRLGRSDLEVVCRRFMDSGVDLKWMTFIRSGTIEGVDTRLLRDAGCTEVQMGLESADSRILKAMSKRADPDIYDKVLRKLLEAGINCACYFIFGFPGETADSAQRTRDFLVSLDRLEVEGSLSWSMFPFHLIPMSPVYEPEARKRYELSGYMENWTHATMDIATARKELTKTFMALDNTGPIYRGDNLEMLANLDTPARKRFHATRQALSKRSSQRALTRDGMLSAFREALLPTD